MNDRDNLEQMPKIPVDGIVTPTYTEYNTHFFNVYYFSDVIKFLELMKKKEGRLQTVVPSFWPNGISSGWNITYSLPKEEQPLEMEILC